MKILVSVHVVWWNASAYYAITAAQALAGLGHDVTVLAPQSTPAFHEARKRNLKTLGEFNLFKKDPISFLRLNSQLTQLLKTEKYDILNPHRPEDHFYLAGANRRLPKPIKLVRTISDVRAPKNNFFNRRLHEKWTDGFIYCARCCQDRYLQRFKLGEVAQQVIYSSLDVDDYTRGDWKTGNPYFNLPGPRLGLIARLSPNKGHRTLLKAVAQVRRCGQSLSVLMVGQEEEVSILELQQYAAQLGVQETLTFTGRLEDPRPAIAACDLGVVASTDSEVISRAAQEFFAFGIPVIASRVNVLPEMVQPEVNGLLYHPGDSQALAAALLRLTRSTPLREKLSRGAFESARLRHDHKVQGSATESMFKTLLHSGA